MGILVFFIILIVTIFTLRFIVMYKTRRILSRINRSREQITSQSASVGNDIVLDNILTADGKDFQAELKQLLKYQKVLDYIRLFTVIILVLVGLLMFAL
jgi:hypothetical protein